MCLIRLILNRQLCLQINVRRCTYCFAPEETLQATWIACSLLNPTHFALSMKQLKPVVSFLQDLATSLGAGADWRQLWAANPGFTASPGILRPAVPVRLGALYPPKAVSSRRNAPKTVWLPVATCEVWFRIRDPWKNRTKIRWLCTVQRKLPILSIELLTTEYWITVLNTHTMHWITVLNYWIIRLRWPTAALLTQCCLSVEAGYI